MKEDKDYYGIKVIARRVSKKYKISQKLAKMILELLIEEIREIVLVDKVEVRLPKLMSMKLIEASQIETDFETNQKVYRDKVYKIRIKPTKQLKQEVKDMRKSPKEDN